MAENALPAGPVLREGEQLDDLQLNGLKILQKKGSFRYGTDAVLLANFAAERVNGDGSLRQRLTQVNASGPSKAASIAAEETASAETATKKYSPVNIIDVGSGTGIIPILMCGKIQAALGNIRFTGIELFEDMCELSRRSISVNGQDDRIQIINGDICDCGLKASTFDVVTINPPYVRSDSGIISDSSEIAHARHEILRTQEEMIAASARLLKYRGKMFMVNRPDRLVDALETMRKSGCEPAEIQMVHAFIDAAPVMFLCSGRKGGGRGLKVLPPVILGGR